MNQEQCQDREGKTHFGEFGWYDGYTGSCRNCRIGLDARNRGACESSDDCAEACLNSLRGTNQNIISQNIANMHGGENQKAKEEKEDKAIRTAKREEEKKKVEEAKRKEEESKPVDIEIEEPEKKEPEKKEPEVKEPEKKVEEKPKENG